MNHDYKVYLTYSESQRGGEICKGDEDKDWPSYEPVYNEFFARNLYTKSTNWCETIPVNFNPKKYIGKPLYLVVVRYQSGSTFGTSHGNWHVVGCYSDVKEADNIQKKISDNKFKGYSPWEGYFERLEDIELTVLILIDNED